MPVQTPNSSQVINGIQWDWSSVEIVADNFPSGGVKSLDFDHSLEPGEGRGTRAQIALRSRGKYTANAAMEMYAYEYHQLIGRLGANGLRGYMEYSFDINVAYAEKNLPVVSWLAAGVRIKKESHAHAEGGELLTVKLDLHVMRLIPTSITGVKLFPVEPSKFIL